MISVYAEMTNMAAGALGLSNSIMAMLPHPVLFNYFNKIQFGPYCFFNLVHPRNSIFVQTLSLLPLL